MHSKIILKKMKNVFPKLCHENKKGENGRIAVIGGSF
jgi:NAD(P)H-hydrate repair Nnr-like enzyme with NAD(P)H-hydrate dehydratase domain